MELDDGHSLHHLSLAERVADRLRAQVYSGELAPRTVLSEAGISRELGVSRSPVREAIAMLVAEGLVQRPPRRSAYVTEYSVEDCRSLYDSRILVDAYLVGQAAKHVDDEGRKILRTQLDELTHASSQPAREYRAAIEKLTFTIYDLGRNPIIGEFAKTLFYRSLPYRSLVPLSSRIGESLEMHREVVEAINAGDPVRGGAATSSGLRDYRDSIIENLSR